MAGIPRPEVETLIDIVRGVVEILDEVEEPLRKYYTEGEDGKFRLQAEGLVPKVKLDEFRKTNIESGKRISELEEKLASHEAIGEDPQELAKEVRELRELRRRVEDKDLVDKKGFESALERRTSEMKATFDSSTKALAEARDQAIAERDQAIARHHRAIIDREISDAALANGVRGSAVPDLLARAERSGWVMSERGRVVMRDEDAIAIGADGITPLTPREWINGQLRDQAPHFFDMPTGGGSLGSGASGAGGKNPWSKDNWNMTEQGQIILKDPAQARRLAANAGVTLNL